MFTNHINSSAYAYDANGNSLRVQKASGGTTTAYISKLGPYDIVSTARAG